MQNIFFSYLYICICVPLKLNNHSLDSLNVYPSVHTEIGYYILLYYIFFLFLNVSKMINLHVQALSILRRRWCNRGRWFFTAAAMHIQSNVYTGIYLFIVWNFTLECKSQWTHYLHKLTFNIAKHWKRVFILFMISLLRHRSRYIN